MSVTPFLIVLGSVALTAFAQVSLKIASGRFVGAQAGESLLGGLVMQLMHPLTLAALAAYVGSTLLWLLALRALPLSVAYTFSGVTIIVVVLLGVFLLGETLGSRQIAGIALVIIGATLVAKPG
ncbi:MAG: SMR family transporter [Burkholderiaceae bacterium]